MSEARIKARVHGRNVADEVFGMIGGDLSMHVGHGADFADALIEGLQSLLPHRKSISVEAPKEIPIARLGATEMPFGEYMGHNFDGTPLDYLDWLCRTQEKFYAGLRAYLKHPELNSHRSTQNQS